MTINAFLKDANTTYRIDVNVGEVSDGVPLLADVVRITQDDDVSEVMQMEVTGPQRHDEVHQAHQW